MVKLSIKLIFIFSVSILLVLGNLTNFGKNVISLPKKWDKFLLEFITGNSHQSKAFWRDFHGRLYHMDFMRVEEDNEFYHSIGKASLIIRGNKLILIDDYKFYNWCGELDCFDSDCNHKVRQKEFSGQQVEVRINIPFLKIKHPTFKRFKAFWGRIGFYINDHRAFITLSINDDVFFNIGYPFQIYHVIEV